jgi:glyoxylase-like metal-dependent hydrolase (beta-lactamase superfamily II)
MLAGVRSGWTEVGDGVLQRRYDPLDISICVVRGGDGLLLVDTRCSPAEADEIRRDLAELGDVPVRRVVNTHAHFDHTFGNQRFADVPILGHAGLPAHLDAYERAMAAERPDVEITPPTELVGDRHVLDAGGRAVELLHLGRGHTDHDLLLHVPDAGVWLVGDVVEESGPPMYGSGCIPLEWPGTITALLGRLTGDDVVVPGHGAPVDRGFVARQQAELAALADLVRALHAAGVRASDAVAEGGDRWPFPPAAGLDHAVAAGYRALDPAEPG